MQRLTAAPLIIIIVLGTFLFATGILNAEGTGTVYINSDGSVSPPEAPIQRDGDLYVLTGNVTCEGDAIIIERANIVLDGNGFWLQGNGTGNGLWLNAGNVTVHSFNIVNFRQGILVNPSEFCRIDSNNLLSNWVGIRVKASNNNSILCNNITDSSSFGIDVYMGYNNSLYRNTIADGGSAAISLYATSHYNSVFRNLLVGNVVGFYIADVARENYIFENSVVNNSWGISLGIVGGEINNTFWHNNFVGNTVQAEISRETILDDGYPSGGNYWSDYTGSDLFRGVYQNETGGDGIGDVPYVIGSEQDRYPLMLPARFVLDVSGDGMIDMLDVYLVAVNFGEIPSSPHWSQRIDVDFNFIVNMLDLYVVAVHFGETVD